jgi:hypothetical protein
MSYARALLLAGLLGLAPASSAAAWPGLLEGPFVGAELRESTEFTEPVPAPVRLVEPLGVPRFGVGPLGLGVDVGQFRLVDPGTSIGLDLRLSWPGGAGSDGFAGFRPYLTMGPALLLAEPPDAASPLGPRADTTVAVGMRAGAGLTWQVDRNATLFGEYRVLHGSAEPLGALGRGAGGDVSGFDILYGLRLRF